MSEPGVGTTSGISSGDDMILPGRHPACRRREPVRPRSRIGGDARPIGFIGWPVDVAFMMLLDEDLPLVARQMPDALLTRACRVECRFGSRLAIDIGACIDGVGEHTVDSVIAGLDPADLGMFVHLQRELHALRAEPQPDAARRAGLGKSLEYALDGGDNSFVGVEQHLAVLFAPDEANRQTAPELAACRLIANAAVEAGA
jgi:hypothetical protein